MIVTLSGCSTHSVDSTPVDSDISRVRSDLIRILSQPEENEAKPQAPLTTLRTLTLEEVRKTALQYGANQPCFDLSGAPAEVSLAESSETGAPIVCVDAARIAAHTTIGRVHAWILGEVVYRYAILAGGSPLLSQEIVRGVMKQLDSSLPNPKLEQTVKYSLFKGFSGFFQNI